jgi:hypothetical protein
MRSLPKTVVLSLLALSFGLQARGEQDIDKLALGTYAGNVGFSVAGHPVLFVGKDGSASTFPQRYELYVSPTTNPTVSNWDPNGGYGFKLVWGSYSGNVHGYWITTPTPQYHGMRQRFFCWQPGGPGGTVQFWNQDRKAQGQPEDNEMWYFEIADHDQHLVRIRNRYSRYVSLGANQTLVSGADQQHAQVFKVDFGVASFSNEW